MDPTEVENLFLGLSAPSPLSSVHDPVLTWHKIEKHNVLSNTADKTEISVNFGKFWKCGFYDWRLIHMSPDGKLNPIILQQPPTLSSFPLKRVNSVSNDYDDDDPYDMDTLTAQGRFIVHAKGVKDYNFHEV